ncbi:serine hydrolase [Neptunitalea sp. Y10]|uniref:Serine hydrolase n=1 Tax=Neptunitalea lumnitzerae TaxID=2965509 RepID=A0ABQ5MF03_9FLAO|nr:serine hydrolase [Neptunitalea sp. Y10]
MVFFSCNDSDDTTTSFNPISYDQLLEDLDFSGYAIITENGEDILRNGYGYANTNLLTPQSSAIQYRLGSVSKTLTAAGIIQLKRDGLITSFEQTIADFDPDFPYGDQITIAQLLSHQSGIPDYLSTIETDALNGTDYDAETIYDIISYMITQNGLLFEPGSQKQYSNSNYLLAALLIEELADNGYYYYITDNILTPLAMYNTHKGNNTVNEQTHALGYLNNQDVTTYPMSITFGAGDWSSTPTDMELWVNAVSSNWYTPNEKELIFTNNVDSGYTDFGLGWFTSKEGAKTMYWHGGDINGFWSMVGFMPENNTTIILLSNHQGDAYSTQRNQIIEALMTSN